MWPIRLRQRINQDVDAQLEALVFPGVAHPAALQEEQDNDVIDRRHVFLGQASSAVSKAGRRSVWLGRQGRVTAPEPCQSMKVYQ